MQGVLELPQLEKVPIVVLGNKIDKVGSVPDYELREALGIQQKNQYGPGTRPIELYMCSVAKKTGYA